MKTAHKRQGRKKYNRPAKITQDVLDNLQQALNDNIKPERKEKKRNGKKGKPAKKEKSSDRSS